MDTKGKGGGGMNWEIGIDIYILLFIQSITNEDLRYSTGTILGVLCDLHGKEKNGEDILHIRLICFAVQ